jgi:hypothetical protein
MNLKITGRSLYMKVNMKSTPEERKKEIVDLLKGLKVGFEFIEEFKFIVYGKYDIFGEILETGYVPLYKYNHVRKTNTHTHTCAGIQAISSYMKQHAL